MTSEHDVDRVLEDWFAQGPSRLPDRVISEAVENIDHIKQRRYVLPPGRERMARLLIAGTGLAAALVAAVVGFATLTGGDGVGGPDGVTYTSDRHGYSVFLPNGWTVEERSGTWELGAFFDANSEAGVDYFEGLDADGIPTLYVYLASQPIPAGMSFDEWVGRHDVATAAMRRASSSSGRTRAASSTARPPASVRNTARTSTTAASRTRASKRWSPITAAATPSTSGRRRFPDSVQLAGRTCPSRNSRRRPRAGSTPVEFTD